VAKIISRIWKIQHDDSKGGITSAMALLNLGKVGQNPYRSQALNSSDTFLTTSDWMKRYRSIGGCGIDFNNSRD
jgi:hypothetical protein